MTIIKDIINQNKRLSKIAEVIAELSHKTKTPSFLVGGCVRDLMLDPEKESIDIILWLKEMEYSLHNN